MRAVLLLLLLTAPWLAAGEPATAPAAVQAAWAGSADSPLHPVKTDSPRDTLRSFMRAMDRHAQAKRTGDRAAAMWLDDATRCLDLGAINPVGREVIARSAAMCLKEVIDRVIVVDYALVPEDAATARWRLRGTEIVIHRVASGERSGEFLFHPDSVARARDFLRRIEDLPLLPGTLGGGFIRPWQEEWVPHRLRGELFGVAWWQWALLGVLIFAGLAMRPVVRLLALLAKTITRRTSAQWDDELVDALAGPATHLGTTGVWFASLHLLGITGGAYTVIAFLIKAAFFVNLAYLAYQLADFLGARIESRVVARRPDINQGLLRLLRQAIKVVALLFCLLLGAQNMGMDVASLIAGLGIGGLAFALAAKDTLANLLGSVMLMLDRPFRIGDAIKVKDVEGMVEEIGFRCTRIRTYHNSLVSMPNSELVMANIDNLGMRRYRRQAFTLGLTYDTPGERLEAFCEAVKNIVKNDAISRKDAIHTCFSGFGASGLEVQVLYFLETADYGEELLHRQTIALQILAAADRLGVRFAYPTQTLHVESAPGAPAPAPAPRDRERLREAAAGFAAGGAHARPDGLGLFTPRHREGV